MRSQRNFYAWLVLLTILSLSVVSAGDFSVSVTTPAASGNVVGDFVFNVTLTNPEVNTTCDIYASSSSTANSTQATLSNANEQNESATSWNATLSTITVEDATDYIVNATCNNGTVIASDTNTGITFDNYIPQTPTSISPTSDSDNSIDFSATVTGANTTACTLFFDGKNPGATSYTMTHSGNSCTHSLTNVPEQTYNYYIQASDGTNTSNSATTTLNIDVQTGSGAGTNNATTTQQKNVALIIIVLVVVGLIWIMNRR